MKASNLYITGASGFIGKNLIKSLKKKNIFHYCVSRKKTEFDNTIELKNYKDLEPKKNSILIHLAENNNISEVDLLGKNYINNNVNTLKLLLKKNWKHAVYISSVMVEQNLNKGLIYKKSKKACEKIILEYGGTILRMTNLYGPYMSDVNIFSDIIKQLNNQSITLKNPNAIRDFLWIDDAVEAIILAIKKTPGGIYNIASGKLISVEEIVKHFLKIHSNGIKNIISTQKNENDYFSAIDIEKTKLDLNWKPNFTIQTGIKKLLKND
tara:strand:- start:243 stop:1043 length:801 start_codon:yes stop_codon:yes gene_type:complete